MIIYRNSKLVVEASLESHQGQDDVLEIYTRQPRKRREHHATVILPPAGMVKLGLLLVEGRADADLLKRLANWSVVMHPPGVKPTRSDVVRDHLTRQQAEDLAKSMKPAKSFTVAAVQHV